MKPMAEAIIACVSIWFIKKDLQLFFCILGWGIFWSSICYMLMLTCAAGFRDSAVSLALLSQLSVRFKQPILWVTGIVWGRSHSLGQNCWHWTPCQKEQHVSSTLLRMPVVKQCLPKLVVRAGGILVRRTTPKQQEDGWEWQGCRVDRSATSLESRPRDVAAHFSQLWTAQDGKHLVSSLELLANLKHTHDDVTQSLAVLLSCIRCHFRLGNCCTMQSPNSFFQAL